jgi:hypothetical protein
VTTDPLRELVIRRSPPSSPASTRPMSSPRVRLAVLKLSEEDGLADPARYLEVAKQDYRDVLAWADRRDYETWLSR